MSTAILIRNDYMNIVSDIKSYTASEAREKLYSLIKKTSLGLSAFEITLRGSEPAVLISKAELEAWQETFDILSSKEEITGIRKARMQTKTVPHSKMLKLIGLNES